MKNELFYLPRETVYRLYKAEVGDTIDGKYVRLHGSYSAHRPYKVASNGLIPRDSDVYVFTFKDLTNGLFYMASNGMTEVEDPNFPNQKWYTEPFGKNTLEQHPITEIAFYPDITHAYKFESIILP